MTDELVETVAKAIFLKEGAHKDVAWEDADKVLAIMPAHWGQKPPRVSDHFRDIARAVLSEIAAAGYAVVPSVLPLAMRKKIIDAVGPDTIGPEGAERLWTLFLSASTKP